MMNLRHARIAFCISIFVLSNILCSGQNWTWAKNAVGAGSSECNGVCTDLNGNIIITGDFDTASVTFGSKTLSNQGGIDAYLTKYDGNGNVIWAVSAGGASDESGTAVCTDLTGNIYVAGYFADPVFTVGLTNLSNAGSDNIFLAKYDPNGNVLWAKSAGGSGADMCYALATDSIGNVFITGSFTSPKAFFGTTTLTNSNTTGGGNVFIAKYDTRGNLLWAKNAGGSDDDEALSICTDKSGHAFVTGYFRSNSIVFGTTTLTNTGLGNANVFIMKCDTNGTALWAKSAGGTSNADKGFSVCTDNSGNAFVTGAYSSSTIAFGTVVLNNATTIGRNNIFVSKYDPDGNILWAKSAGGTQDDGGYSISTDVCGDAYVTGFLNSPSALFGTETLLQPAGNCIGGCDPMFVAKYDPSGHVLCTSALASGGDDAIEIIVDPRGNVFLAGDYLSDPFQVGIFTLPYAGYGEKTFVAQYVCTALSACVGQSSPLCSGNCNGKAEAIVTGGIAPFSYSWNTQPPQSTQTATGLCPGKYEVKISDASGASQTDTVALSPLLSGPTASAGNNVSVLIGQSVMLSASGGGTYFWSPSQGLSCDSCSNPNANPSSTTTYCVTVKDSKGCTNSSCLQVRVECGEVFVPNYFSPNGDGENDKLCIFGSCIQSFTITIYDRWGERVFETSDRKECWDGVYKGQAMNTAVFVYYLKATLLTGEVISQKGNISLVR